MREYDQSQIPALVAGPRFIDEPTERICPACGHRAVRTYVYRNTGPGRTARITYSWCASCRRFKGWTGPDSDGLKFSDPLESLSQDDRNEMTRDLDEFFKTLDKLWESGELPQRFHR